MVFRRVLTSDYWHWRHDCSDWPGHTYVQVVIGRRKTTQRPHGKLCKECLLRESIEDNARRQK